MSPTVPPIRRWPRPPRRRADAGAALDEFLDFVGDVRDDLHGLAQVVAAALLLEHDW
jgi:hypothetical protein